MSIPDHKTSIEVEINTLLRLIPDFNTLEPTQVYGFIRSCDSAFQLASNCQEIILLTYTLNSIKGPGSSDVRSKKFFKWNDLKSFLIQKYSQTKTLTHLNLELQSLYQNPQESITDYFHRVDLCRSKIVEKITAEISDSTLEGRIATAEETALNVFVNGLNSDIGIMLRIHSFKTLSDACNFAIQEEKVRNMIRTRQMLFRNSIPSNFPKRPIQPTQPRAPPQRQENAQPRFSNDIKHCNYCKKAGHLIADCRKRAYNNSRQSQSWSANVNNLNLDAAGATGTPSETAPTQF